MPAREVAARDEAIVSARLHVSKHPLVREKLTRLRDERTPPTEFRRLVHEIAKVFKLVLADTKPAIMQKGPEAGQPSRARYVVGKAAAEAARERVAALQGRYPVYPEIDLDLLRSAAQQWGEASRPAAAAVH